MGFDTGSSGTYNLGGNGSLTTTGTLFVGQFGNGNSGSGTFNQSGTSRLTVNTVSVGGSTPGNTEPSFNLNGGTLTTASIQGFSATATVNFNGGTLVASANSSNFISGLRSANVGSGGLTIDTAGFAVGVSQLISSAPTGGAGGGLTKRGAGTLTLGSSVIYDGATTVAGGTLSLGPNAYLLPHGAVTVNAGAALTLGAANRVSAVPLTLAAPAGTAPATFNTGGFSQRLAFLTLDGDGDGVIDLGAGASQLRFSDSSTQPWRGTLSIYNYSGNPIVGLGADELFFGTGPTGLTAAQLAQIRFYSDAGTTLLAPAGFASLTGGEVVPGGLFPVAIPEPSTWALLLAAGAGLLAVGRVPSRRSEAL